MDLHSPSVLAQLPRPLHASTGSSYVGEVYSLAGLKRRKRYEVAVAVDGEAVNIYSVQTPKQVTSYAVPPRSSFSCRPCSVRRKLLSSMRRRTYCAISRPEHEVKSFTEESLDGSSVPVIVSSSFAIKDSRSPAVFISIIPTTPAADGEEDPFDILTVHKDGRVRRLSPDLKTQRWSIRHSEVAKVSSSHEINACFLIDFEEAKKSLFKKRQDLAALALGSVTEYGVDHPSILLIVSHPVSSEKVSLKDVIVQVFAVPANITSSSAAFDESQRMRHLLTMDMPEVDCPDTFWNQSLQWDFHSGSAGLSLSFGRGLISLDLSQYSPTVSSQINLPNEQFSSVMRISPHSVIGAGKAMVALYDTHYQSIQRSITNDSTLSSGSPENTVFVGYFSKLGVAVAMKGDKLLAFDLGLDFTPGSSNKRSRDGLLIEAVARGVVPLDVPLDKSPKRQRTDAHVAPLGPARSEPAERQKQLILDLRECVRSRDADSFDSTVQTYFGMKTLPGSVNIHPQLPVLILSQIFSLEESKDSNKISTASSPHLSINLWPKNTCNWLIQLGHLCMSSVEAGLRQSSRQWALFTLPKGSFVQALVDSDRSLRHLNQVLQSPLLMDPDELAYALKIFLSMAHSCSTAGNERPKVVAANEQQANSAATSFPAPSSRATLASIYRGLNTALETLRRHPISSITESLRGTLSKQDLIFIVHHLRLSLATGGYTSRFTEDPPTPISPHQTKPALSLNTIVDILSAAVDAIGPPGWITASSDDLGPELDLIADLKSEISAALAGVEEATYLKGILKEYIQFAESVSNRSVGGTELVQRPLASSATLADQHNIHTPRVRAEKLNGAILIAFDRAATGGDGNVLDGDASGKILPLSLKASLSSVSVGRMKANRSTGEVRSRSSREIGYLRRKQAGQYSFERLIV